MLNKKEKCVLSDFIKITNNDNNNIATVYRIIADLLRNNVIVLDGHITTHPGKKERVFKITKKEKKSKATG
jgi:hypothetical protein